MLELREPVRVQRPLHEPLRTRRLAVASDDPQRLVASLLRTAAQREGEPAPGLLAAFDVAGLLRDAAQPA